MRRLCFKSRSIPADVVLDQPHIAVELFDRIDPVDGILGMTFQAPHGNREGQYYFQIYTRFV